MKFTVYHLKELEKVGCTNNFPRRMEEQGFEPKPEYIKFIGNMAEASYVEETLRQFYGYKPDTYQTYEEQFTKGNMTITKKWNKTHSIGWNELPTGSTRKELLADLNQYSEVIFDTKIGIFKFGPNNYGDLVRMASSSQYEGSDFYWNTKILSNLNDLSNDEAPVAPCAHDNTIPEFQQIRDWAEDKGIFSKGDAKTQYLKLQEEAGELARAILKNDEDEIIDALGDIVVVAINLSHLCGYRLEDCLESAYQVISKRKGNMINGTFVKQESL